MLVPLPLLLFYAHDISSGPAGCFDGPKELTVRCLIRVRTESVFQDMTCLIDQRADMALIDKSTNDPFGKTLRVGLRQDSEGMIQQLIVNEAVRCDDRALGAQI